MILSPLSRGFLLRKASPHGECPPAAPLLNVVLL
jgi:hypothetical protein